MSATTRTNPRLPRLRVVVNPGRVDPASTPSETDCAVTITGLQVRYGSNRALLGLDLDVPAHRITALLGPNGAGKSTTVGVIAGLISPDAGRVTVLGGDPGRPEARRALGVMLQEGGIPTGAQASSIVRHHAALRGAEDTAEAVIDDLELASIGRTTFRRMSGGQKRTVALGCALVGNPSMVIVDEPTAGLDPQARRRTWQILDRLRERGVTVLLCTHDLDEAERLGDHVAIISAGRLALQGARDVLLGAGRDGADADSIAFEGPLHLDLTTLQDALPVGTRVSEIVPGRYRVQGRLHAKESTIITAWASQHGIASHRIRAQGSTLEDLYFSVTGVSDDETDAEGAGKGAGT